MWTYQHKAVNSIKDIPEGVYGFVYIIHADDGGKYIGRKKIWSKRKKRFGKRKIAQMEDKRLKRWEYIVKENDWLEYTGSNKRFNEHIQTRTYCKEILRYCYTPKELSYFEEKYLFMYGVLESPIFFNDNIGGRYFNVDISAW